MVTRAPAADALQQVGLQIGGEEPPVRRCEVPDEPRAGAEYALSGPPEMDDNPVGVGLCAKLRFW